MCWLCVYTWLCVKIKVKGTLFVVFCRSSWIIERGNFLCARYASKFKLRVPLFVVFCRVSGILERGNFLCAGYAYAWLRIKIKVKGGFPLSRKFYVDYANAFDWLYVRK